MKPNSINRRQFLKIMSATGANLVIGIYLTGCREPDVPPLTATPSSTPIPTAVSPTAVPTLSATPTPEAVTKSLPIADADTILAPNIYLQIDPNGDVTVTAFRSEMGQGIRTSIAMILAEELDVPWEAVTTIEQAKADPAYGNQATGGSLSVSQNFTALRRAGAAVRHMLVQAAAQHWEIEPASCTTEPGFVIHPDGETQLAYGELVAAAAQLEVPRSTDVTLKSVDTFHILGKRKGNWDAAQMVTGQAVYGMDFRLPGMLFAAIARCPVFGGRVASFDASAALEVPGVHYVERIDDWIAVVADNSWAAFQGRDALTINWNEGETAVLSSDSIRSDLQVSFPDANEVEDGVLTAVYDIPFQAHMTMEPMNCTAHVHDGMCDVWAPTQDPQDAHRAVSIALRMDWNDVTVNVLLMGGGFGRRLNVDYAVEAALVSQAIGAPIQVIWSREDDVQHDFYHPMSSHYASVNLDDIESRAIRSRASREIPSGSWRSVFNFPEAFANECFFDEIAHALGHDPYEFRIAHYDDRAKAVLQLAAEGSGWGDPLPAGWGRGIAYHAVFGVTHVAQVAEVEVNDAGEVRVHRVMCAVDCGLVVNPDGAEAQIQGGIVFGLTAALKAQITVENGRVQQSNFHNCPILQFNEMPEIEVIFVESQDRPKGIGEMGVPPIAPAIANAVYAATGKRIRYIPITAQDLRD
ncbi:MAG: xanthine dehydrogenase family protein molybdopterin-binding subunit [Chloroflexi bacterium]|nr:xanthine dehydrogenase family protein molybdopterin-binding subunit [Chloroflexota bacterium]